VVVVIGLVAAIAMVYAEWGKNDTNPTLIALNTAKYPIWNIDFPAVTLCGLNRIKKSTAITVSNKWYVTTTLYLCRHKFREPEVCNAHFND
jgi:hypothetical protein